MSKAQIFIKRPLSFVFKWLRLSLNHSSLSRTSMAAAALAAATEGVHQLRSLLEFAARDLTLFSITLMKLRKPLLRVIRPQMQHPTRPLCYPILDFSLSIPLFAKSPAHKSEVLDFINFGATECHLIRTTTLCLVWFASTCAEPFL